MSIEQSQEYRGNGNHEWEDVAVQSGGAVQRLRVPGGWLYSTVRLVTIHGEVDEVSAHMDTVYVPMPDVVKHKV